MSMTKMSQTLPAGRALMNGDYIIEKTIGIGGFGITYYARHATLEQHYAIKEFYIYGFCERDSLSGCVLPQGMEQGEFENYREKFIEEAKMLASLTHPNIVSVIYVFDENNTSYIVMPFIEGKTLQQVMQGGGRLEYDLIVNYTVQICEALAYIHSKNILHRDITPDNIMITEDAKAILIDFGAARRFINDKTQLHTTIVKEGYAPLEQYSKKSRKGAYSDLYSLGAVLYYVFTGQKPIPATQRIMDPLPQPKALSPDIPDEINDLIMKSMAMKAKDRYQSAESLMEDLLKIEPPKITATHKSKIKKIVKKTLPFISIAFVVIVASCIILVFLAARRNKKTDMEIRANMQEAVVWLDKVDSLHWAPISNEQRFVFEYECIKSADRNVCCADSIISHASKREFEQLYGDSLLLMRKFINSWTDSTFNNWKHLAKNAYSIYSKNKDSGIDDTWNLPLVKRYIDYALMLRTDNELELLNKEL